MTTPPEVKALTKAVFLAPRKNRGRALEDAYNLPGILIKKPDEVSCFCNRVRSGQPGRHVNIDIIVEWLFKGKIVYCHRNALERAFPTDRDKEFLKDSRRLIGARAWKEEPTYERVFAELEYRYNECIFSALKGD